MLDETTCPVCGKDLADTTIWAAPSPEIRLVDSGKAVAHYLAHLAQTQALPTLDLDVQYRIASEIAQRYARRNEPDEPR